LKAGIGFGFGLGVLVCCASALAAGTDESWEMSIKMDMQGMSMPAMTHMSCLPKGGAYKPDDGAKDKNCQMTDVKVAGNTTRWTMQCSGPQAMTGTGEVTRTADTMKGTMKMSMRDQGRAMEMTQVISGKRVGTCDAVAERKKIDDQVATIVSDMCKGQVESAVTTGGYEPRMPEAFTRKEQCLSSKPAVCERARAFMTGYDQYSVYAKSRGWVVKECGIDLEAKRTALCKTAVAERKNPFIRGNCPAEAAAFRADYDRNCQGFGRGYTADAAHPNAKLCGSLRYWASRSAQPGQDDAADSTADASPAADAPASGVVPSAAPASRAAQSAAPTPGSAQAAAKDAGKKDAKADPAAAVLEGIGSTLKGLFGR
jgi:hypothetical protein